MRSVGLAAFALVFALPLTALADVPPGDVCGQVGAACQQARPDFKTPGICRKATCSRMNLSTGKEYTYDCLRCEPTGAKAAPSASVAPTPTTTPAVSTTPVTPPPPPSPSATPAPTPPPEAPKSSGCQLSRSDNGLAAFAALALGLLLFRRSR
jgi:hypothetical protein